MASPYHRGRHNVHIFAFATPPFTRKDWAFDVQVELTEEDHDKLWAIQQFLRDLHSKWCRPNSLYLLLTERPDTDKFMTWSEFTKWFEDGLKAYLDVEKAQEQRCTNAIEEMEMTGAD